MPFLYNRNCRENESGIIFNHLLKGNIMAKSAKAVQSTLPSFAVGVASISAGGESFKTGVTIVARHIMAAKTYDEQQDLMTKAAQAICDFKTIEARALGDTGYKIQLDSARKAMKRAIAKLDAKFTWLKSDKPEAVKKAKTRGAKGKALKTGIKPADKKPSAASVTNKAGALQLAHKTLEGVLHNLNNYLPANSYERIALQAAFTVLGTEIDKLLK